MAVFRIQVNYTFGTNAKWSNVWHATAADMGEIILAVDTVMKDPLLSALSSACVLKSFLVSDPASPAFLTIDENEAGTNGDIGSLLPLFNSAKVIFPAADLGRPDLKYMKGCVGENNQTATVLDSAFVTALDNIITGLLADMDANGTPLGNESGVAYSVASVQPAVQMRQMHRKRRKTVVAP